MVSRNWIPEFPFLCIVPFPGSKGTGFINPSLLSPIHSRGLLKIPGIQLVRNEWIDLKEIENVLFCGVLLLFQHSDHCPWIWRDDNVLNCEVLGLLTSKVKDTVTCLCIMHICKCLHLYFEFDNRITVVTVFCGSFCRWKMLCLLPWWESLGSWPEWWEFPGRKCRHCWRHGLFPSQKRNDLWYQIFKRWRL